MTSFRTVNGRLGKRNGKLLRIGAGGTDCCPECTTTATGSGTNPGCPSVFGSETICATALHVSSTIMFDNGTTQTDYSGEFDLIRSPTSPRWETGLLSRLDAAGRPRCFVFIVFCGPETPAFWHGGLFVRVCDGRSTTLAMTYIGLQAFMDGPCPPLGPQTLIGTPTPNDWSGSMALS